MLQLLELVLVRAQILLRLPEERGQLGELPLQCRVLRGQRVCLRGELSYLPGLELELIHQVLAFFVQRQVPIPRRLVLGQG